MDVEPAANAKIGPADKLEALRLQPDRR